MYSTMLFINADQLLVLVALLEVCHHNTWLPLGGHPSGKGWKSESYSLFGKKGIQVKNRIQGSEDGLKRRRWGKVLSAACQYL